MAGRNLFHPRSSCCSRRYAADHLQITGSFPTEEATTKLIYLAIQNFEKSGRNVREWFAARNQFAIMFEERFSA